MTWHPKPAQPQRRWSHPTLIRETKYVNAKNSRHLASPFPTAEPPAARSRSIYRNLDGVAEPPGRLPSRRRRRERLFGTALLVSGPGLILLNVLSMHEASAAEYYLILIFGLLLILRGLESMIRSHR